MSFLPSSHPRIGTLQLDTVLEWYDGPVLFSARNELAALFLGVAVEEATYLYIPISEDRLMALRTGLLSIRDAFLNPETRAAFVVTSDGQTDERTIDNVPPQWLPSGEDYLARPPESNAPVE